jgi:RNA polymerase sigma factor (sigma-70 family)
VTAASSLDAYVRQVLVNVYLEDQRGWWRRRVLPAAEPRPPGAAGGDDTEVRLDLRAALARLTPRQRAVLVLRYWEGLDVASAAEAMGCSTGTVKSLSSHGIAALRRLLPGYGPATESTIVRDRP